MPVDVHKQSQLYSGHVKYRVDFIKTHYSKYKDLEQT